MNSVHITYIRKKFTPKNKYSLFNKTCWGVLYDEWKVGNKSTFFKQQSFNWKEGNMTCL